MEGDRMIYASSTSATTPLSVALTIDGIEMQSTVTETDNGGLLLELSSNETGGTIGDNLDVLDNVIGYIKSIDHMMLRNAVDNRLNSVADDPYAAAIDVIVDMLIDAVESGQL